MNKDKPCEVTQIDRHQSIPTGTRGQDCKLRLDLFTPTLLSLNIEGASERTTTPLLTREAAIALRAQLDELISQMQPSAPQDEMAEGESDRRAA